MNRPGIDKRAAWWTVGVVAAVGSIIFLAGPTTKRAAPSLDDLRFGRVIATGDALREAVRDPESLVFEEIRATDDASVICFRYRARNGFGGMNREVMVVADGKASQSVIDWHLRCPSTAAYDYALGGLNRR